MSEKRYIPALSIRSLTPFYNPILKWVMREETFKRKLVMQTNIQPGMHILEEAADNFDGLIPQFITEAEFKSIKEAENFVSIFGPLSLWRAVQGA